MEIRHVNLAKGYRGGERQTELLIEALAAMGVKQSLVCRDDSPMRNNLADINDLEFISANNQLQGIWCTGNADIVHAHEAKAVHWAWLNNLLKNTPYVITRRLDNPVKDSWINGKTYTAASCVVSISKVIMQGFKEKGLPHLKRIPDVAACLEFDNDEVEQIRSTLEGKFVIGHIGALIDSHKGQRVLIDAARRLETSHPDVQILFLGSGSDAELLQSESAGLSNITWLGFKSNVADYIACFDLFAFPSRNEGFGSTLLDVIQGGVPIVASNVGGIPDVISDRETGLLVTPGSSAELYEAIVELYNNPGFRDQLVASAKGALHDYLPETAAEQYMDCYRECLNR